MNNLYLSVSTKLSGTLDLHSEISVRGVTNDVVSLKRIISFFVGGLFFQYKSPSSGCLSNLVSKSLVM